MIRHEGHVEYLQDDHRHAIHVLTSTAPDAALGWPRGEILDFPFTSPGGAPPFRRSPQYGARSG
jgi:hypothetical protein